MRPASALGAPVVVATAALAAVALAAAQPAVQPGTPPASVAAADEAPAWSPQAATVVYTSGASGNSDLWLRRGPGGPPRNLTDHEAQDHVARWFPDGERLAFQTTRDGQREIYLVGADGAGLRNLSAHPAQDLLPDVAPDGRRLAFFSDRGLEHGPRELPGHLYVVDVEGGEPVRLTAEPLTSTFGPAWSPGGGEILYARDFDGDVDLVVADVASGVERRLPGTPAAEYGGRFSPDGRWLAFHAATDDGESRVVVMRPDGSERRELTHGAQHYQPHWSPDGRWLLFTGAPLGASQFDLLMVPAAGGEVEALVATEDDERAGSWSPVE